MLSSRQCLLTFAYHHSMTLLTFHSITIRSWTPVGTFFNPITNTIFNSAFQRKSCTSTCNLALEQVKGVVIEHREGKPHTLQALKQVFKKQGHTEYRRGENKVEYILYPIRNYSLFNMKAKTRYNNFHHVQETHL